VTIDGPPDKELFDRLWNDFAHSGKAELLK
jgi:hypothetical protein